jgi:hypothetical protein
MKNPHRTFAYGTIIFFLFIAGCSPAFIYHHHPDIAKAYLLHKSDRAKNAAEEGSATIEILVNACSLMTMYQYAFTMELADRMIEIDYDKGTKLYAESHLNFIKAYHFGERAIEEKHPGFGEWLSGKSQIKPNFDEYDVSILYWTGAALGGAISSSRGNPNWIIRLPKVGTLFKGALSINPDWKKGALYSAMISFSMSQPDNYSSNLRTAENYLFKADRASGGFHTAAQLTFAETVSVKSQDKDEFLKKVNKVLNQENNNEIENMIIRQRAEWLLTRTEDLCY